MENKTAIEILEHHKMWLENPPTFGQCSMIAEAVGVAIEALEKQMPKKPIKDNHSKYMCSHCNDVYAIYTYKPLYCPICGGKQKWSEVE